MSDICKHGLRGEELLISALKRFRARMAEEMRQEQTSLDFFVSHGQHAKAGWNELRLEGLRNAIACMNVALSQSPTTAHLQDDTTPSPEPKSDK